MQRGARGARHAAGCVREQRKGGDGEHQRGDPERLSQPDRLDDDWMKHTMTYYDEATRKTSVTYRPIHYETLDEDECAVVPPVARVY